MYLLKQIKLMSIYHPNSQPKNLAIYPNFTTIFSTGFYEKVNKIQLSMALDPFFEALFWIKEFHFGFYLSMLDTIKRIPNMSLIKLTITSSQQISNALQVRIANRLCDHPFKLHFKAILHRLHAPEVLPD